MANIDVYQTKEFPGIPIAYCIQDMVLSRLFFSYTKTTLTRTCSCESGRCIRTAVLATRRETCFKAIECKVRLQKINRKKIGWQTISRTEIETRTCNFICCMTNKIQLLRNPIVSIDIHQTKEFPGMLTAYCIQDMLLSRLCFRIRQQRWREPAVVRVDDAFEQQYLQREEKRVSKP